MINLLDGGMKMSENVFYADLDIIDGKGVLVTGHGKGLVSKNSLINGEYIANDMVKLVIESNKLFGYQGYVEKEEKELATIDYLLYFYDQSEKDQPVEPLLISVDEYLKLSKHNIDTGEQSSQMVDMMMGNNIKQLGGTYTEYAEILKQASQSKFYKIPFTKDENERARLVNNLIQ